MLRASDLPLRYNAVEILERNLPERSDKIALHSEDRSLTFSEVAEEVGRVGNALLDLDVRAGDRVGILAPDCAEWATTFFGTLKVGAVAVGMNTLLTPGEQAFMLRDSRIRVLVTHSTLLSVVEEALRDAPSVRHVIVIGGESQRNHLDFEEWIAGRPTQLESVDTHRNEAATLNYSSGTTGEPKGIFHAHKDLILTAQLWGVDVLGLVESDRTFSLAKLFFSFGLGGNLLFPWFVGASVVLRAGASRDTAGVLEAITRSQATIVYNAPTGYAVALAVPDLTERYDLSNLRLCVSAGEALPAPIWHQWKDRTGIEIIDGIGSTENFHIFLSNRPGDVRPGSSGRPVPGYELRIVNDDGEPVPPGEVGRLQLKGETAALAYLNQYARSKGVFLGEWIDTGDKYSMDEDGYYWHAGRSDDMLKVGGIWVSPVEVESTLIGHPAVAECAVVGARDGSDLVKPEAWVIVAPGHEASDGLAEELIAHCADRMARYKRPRWIRFTDDLPRTATGKIQRYRLREGAEG